MREAKAEVDVVTPFLLGEGSVCVWVGESREPSPSVFAALQATLLRQREGGRVRSQEVLMSLGQGGS